MYFEARGNVEDWLGKVEEAMGFNLRKLAKLAMQDFSSKIREDWCVDHCSQVVLTISQVMWCSEVTEIFNMKKNRTG